MLRIFMPALVLALAAVPLSQAQAFGSIGHEAICEIAFQELSDAARQRVGELIQQDPRFHLFRTSCNFADQPRQRAEEHFVNLPRDADGIEDDPCPLADKCVVSAIEDDLAVLRTNEASDAWKLEALKFLGHWVGDLHQPLHVSFEDDRGGNSIKAQGTSCDNLHAVWDRCLLEQRIGMDPVAIATAIRSGITDARRSAWLAGSVKDWANESFAIATSLAVQYCVQVSDACRYANDNVQLDPGEPEKVVVADAGYLDANAPALREQIATAGVRLAGLLNQAFAPDGGPEPEAGLRARLLQRIEAIERELADLRSAVEAIQE